MAEIQRKLASIRQIAELRPIPGADMIECARIDGWEVVVKKGEFALGDKCVYFEIDSFLPVREEYEFLRKSGFKSTKHLGDGFRLRTIKLRGQISQGLALPSPFAMSYDVGKDVTELLGVKKWELPEKGSPLMIAGYKTGSHSFPKFLRKTDQERIQNCFEQIKRLPPETPFEMTLKLDGSSMTVWHKDGKSGVCSRNLNLHDRTRTGWLARVRQAGEWLQFRRGTLDRLEERLDALKCRVFGGRPGLIKRQNTFWETAKKQGLIDFLERIGGNFALQGELMGPGIQGNREGFPEHRFFLFDVWNIDQQRYLSPNEREEFLLDFNDGFQLDHAPLLGYVNVADLTSVAHCLKLASIDSITHPIAEGVVFKSENGKISFKAINNAFLLKEAA